MSPPCTLHQQLTYFLACTHDNPTPAATETISATFSAGAQARIDYGMQILHIFSTRRAARVAAEALAATDRTFVFPDEHDPVGYRSLEAATTVLSTCLIEQDVRGKRVRCSCR